MDQVFDTRHLIVPEKGRLMELLPPILELSTERVSELLDLGCVYLNKKRVLDNMEVPSLSYLRVHCKPKRYDISAVDWKSRVVFENEHFVVVNKPSGFPVPSAVDNVRETVVAQIAKVVGHKLFVTQRLDVLTDGLFIFGKSIEFQGGFNKVLAGGRLRKEYLAKTTGSPKLGLHVHYLMPSWGAPKKVSLAPEADDWKECRLEVLETNPIELFSYTRIRLLTGRTHQIRAQMSALGHPLWGDKLYAGPGAQSEFSLTSKLLEFECPVTRQHFSFEL
jgi:23S rRNA pseudouridine1911/1915/1917 synthase